MPGPTDHAGGKGLELFAAAGLVLAAGALAYSNSLSGPFIFDDASSIVGNPTIHHLATGLTPPHAAITVEARPVLNLSLAINYALGGAAVAGYHWFNAIVHLSSGLLLLGLVRRSLQLPPLASRFGRSAWPLGAIVATLWVVHPLQTEAVTYIIQRAESLMGFFYLLTLYAFVRGSGAGTNRWWLALSVAAALAGMGTKEVMVSAPLIVLLYDRTFVAGSFAAALRRRGYYLALACTWLLLIVEVVQAGGNRGGSFDFRVGVVSYWLTQFPAVLHYLKLVVWPSPLVFEYGAFTVTGPADFLPGAIVVLSLLSLTIVGLFRWPVWGFLGTWFFALLAPTSLMPGTTQMIVEHRMYLPLAAVLAGGIAALYLTLRRWNALPLGAGLAGIAAVAFVILTFHRNEVYRSERSIWEETVRQRPNNPLAREMLGLALDHAGDSSGAVEQFSQALRLKPNFSVAHEGLGEALFRVGRRTEAVTHFQAALDLQPGFADAHDNLGAALLAGGAPAEAVPHLREAIRLKPDYAEAYYNLGGAYAMTGDGLAAVAAFQRALELRPDYAEAAYNLANTLAGLGRSAEAISAYENALRLRPDFARAHYNLANVLIAKGRLADAIAQYEAALRIQPNDPNAENNLGSALLDSGRVAEAVAHFQSALALDADSSEARTNLERARRLQSPSSP